MCRFLSLLLLAHMSTAGINSNIYFKLSESTRRSLEYLCPGVDVCAQNASDSSIGPNQIVNVHGDISCCKGCSCHADCYDQLNCCFPEYFNKQNRLSDSKPEWNASEASEHDVDKRHVFGNEHDIGNTFGFNCSFYSTSTVVDKEGNTIPSPLSECLYVQSGIPDESWVTSVESYRMVSRPPHEGCLPTPIEHSGTSLELACLTGSLAPWDSMYPVYSSEHNTIYKNKFCARCHGANDLDSWTPYFVCNQFEKNSDRSVAISEHIWAYQNKEFCGNCRIWFLYDNVEVLRDKRCYVDYIRKCPSNTEKLEQMWIPPGLNITSREIIDACQMGLTSPIAVRKKVYSNAFCAMCNREYNDRITHLFCSPDDYRTEDTKTFGDFTMTYLLDVSILHQNYQQNNPSKTHPKACVITENEWINESCRDKFCKSVQIRNSFGDCEYPSKVLYTDPMHLLVKLSYLQKNVSVISVLKSNNVALNSNLVHKFFKVSSPWPSYWKIMRIFDIIERDIDNDPCVVVELETKTVHLDVLSRDIVRVMKNVWKIVIQGEPIIFDESLLRFRLKEMPGGTYVPYWKLDSESIASLNISVQDSRKWRPIYGLKDISRRYSTVDLSKLFVCDQVVLRYGEYMLTEKNLALLNKLNGQVMFDREFELVMDDGGKLLPRVCLSDTPLKEINAAESLCGGYLYYLVFWILTNQF